MGILVSRMGVEFAAPATQRARRLSLFNAQSNHYRPQHDGANRRVKK